MERKNFKNKKIVNTLNDSEARKLISFLQELLICELCTNFIAKENILGCSNSHYYCEICFEKYDGWCPKCSFAQKLTIVKEELKYIFRGFAHKMELFCR